MVLTNRTSGDCGDGGGGDSGTILWLRICTSRKLLRGQLVSGPYTFTKAAKAISSRSRQALDGLLKRRTRIRRFGRIKPVDRLPSRGSKTEVMVAFSKSRVDHFPKNVLGIQDCIDAWSGSLVPSLCCSTARKCVMQLQLRAQLRS